MKNKQIDQINNVMSKRHGIFSKKIYYPFSNAGKSGNVPQFKFDKF